MNILLYAMQCSQRIVTWVVLLAIIHNLGTSMAVVIFPDAAGDLRGVLEACQPLYKLSISAYFGKAAIENCTKDSKKPNVNQNVFPYG